MVRVICNSISLVYVLKQYSWSPPFDEYHQATVQTKDRSRFLIANREQRGFILLPARRVEDAPSLFLKDPSSSSNHLVKPNCTHTRASNSFKQLFSSVCVVLHVYFRILHFPFAKLWNCSMQCAVVEIVPRDMLVCTGMVLFHFISQTGIYLSSI